MKNITIVLLTGILALTLNVQQAESSGPQITSTSPAQNEQNVPVDTDIEVEFDTIIAYWTLNDYTFIVSGRSTGLHKGSIAWYRCPGVVPTRAIFIGLTLISTRVRW